MRQQAESANPSRHGGCAAIILAAGASIRLGQPKQLLAFRGRSLLRHAAATALEAICRPVVVVLGAHAGRLQTELTDLPVKVVLNPGWQEGMASSIRVGLEAVTSGTTAPDAVIIMLCDQSLVTSGMLNQLINTHHSEARGIVASAYRETLGVPALFSRKHYAELASLEGDQGAKRIIVKYANDRAQIAMPQAAFDVDRPEEAERLKQDCGA
jgi:molybdenum cofactor cytidylyltransferase